jgi:hypothetical protein
MPGVQSIVDLLHVGTAKLNKGMPELDWSRMAWQKLTQRVVKTVAVCSDPISVEGLSHYGVV